jgi:TolB protein
MQCTEEDDMGSRRSRYAPIVTLAVLTLLLGSCNDATAPPSNDDGGDGPGAHDGDAGAPSSAAISVTAPTTGSSLDADGYSLVVNGAEHGTIEINGTATLTDVPAGTHEVALTGVASNCAVQDPNPQAITVKEGAESTMRFAVTCVAVPRAIVFASNRNRSKWCETCPTLNQGEIYAVRADGTGLVRLTDNHPVSDWGPAWSPDGTRLAFITDGYEGGLAVMDAAGTDRMPLLTVPSDPGDPAWSPDGTTIAFTKEKIGWFDWHVYLVSAGDGEPVRITHDSLGGSGPTWSPDGTRIAFSAYQNGQYAIYVMDADGSDARQLSSGPGHSWDPAWSPDGTRLAFTRSVDDDREIYVMDADGSNPINLTRHPGSDCDPAWSPDGTQIAFTTGRDGNGEIYVMDADGSNPINLTNHPAGDWGPAWSPVPPEAP